MTENSYNLLRDKNEEDEKRFSDFLVKSSYALIAANWALINQADRKFPTLSCLSIAFSVLFLFLRGIGHYLNVKHNYVILDAESSKSKKYADDGIKQTWQGRLSNKLVKLEISVIFAATLLFFALVTVIFLN